MTVGLFSFVGKAIGGIAKTALGLVPGGNVVKTALKIGGGLVGNLLHAKQPMATTSLKHGVATAYSVPTLRAQPRFVMGKVPVRTMPGGSVASPGPAVLRASPVMPGGSIATSAGIMAPGGGLPPASYGGRSTGKRRKRKSTAARRSSRKRSSTKRRSGGRKLKFGSPAWRKKYMKRKR